MKKIKVLGQALRWAPFIFLLSINSGFAALAGLNDTVVVVDKKVNKIHLANYNDGRLDVVKSYRATFGKSEGDKLMEGDLKTPEGIYEFLYRKTPPQLGPKFGPLGIYISYPNSMDRNGAKTGNQILLHGTDDPSRLERPFDSLGCVVTDNENVLAISNEIKIKDTKIVITRDFEALNGNPRMERLKAFFNAWLKAWSTKDLAGYVESYADEYKAEGMNRLAFANYKDSLNKKYDTINVTASDAKFYLHEKYDLITFTQNYQSTFKGGVPAYNGTTQKNLYVQERNGHFRIVMEETRK